jgi:hypothetical protein
MALEFQDEFETGSLGTWTSTSGPPTITADSAYIGQFGLKSDHSSGSQWAVRRFAAPPSGGAFRFYFKLTTAGTVRTSLFRVEDTPQAEEMGFVLNASDQVVGYIFDGTSTADTTARSITLGTWYRLEAKMDWSAAAWKLTWGMAVGEGPLTVYDTDFTGGLTNGASTLDYCRLGGVTGGDTRVVRYDSYAMANTAAEYAIGSPEGIAALSRISATAYPRPVLRSV